MKKMLVLLLSISTLYATQEPENPVGPEMGINIPMQEQVDISKNVTLEEKVTTDAEKMRNKINGFLESEEVKAVQSATLTIAKTGWGLTKSLFYDEQSGPNYRNIGIAATFISIIAAKRYFFGLGGLKRQMQQNQAHLIKLNQKNQAALMEQHQATQELIANSMRILNNNLTNKEIAANARLNELASKMSAQTVK